MGRAPGDEDPADTRQGARGSLLGSRHQPGEQEVPTRRRRLWHRLPGWTRKPGPMALATILALIVGCGLYATVDLLAESSAAVSPTEPPQPPPFVAPPQTDNPVGVGDPAEGVAGTPAPSGSVAPPPTDQAGRPAPTRTAGRSAAAGTFCTATFTISSRWPGGYQAEVAVANTGATILSGWTASWTFTNGEAITQLWNGQDTAAGAQHTVRNAEYNGGLAPGTSTTFGFTVNVGVENASAPAAACTAQA